MPAHPCRWKNQHFPAGKPQTVTHTHHRLCVPSPEPVGPTRGALCRPHGPPEPAPSTQTPEPDPNPGPRARSSKPKRVELPGAGRDLEHRDDPGGTRDAGDTPRAALLRVARTDIDGHSRRTQPWGCLTSSRLRTKLLPQQTPSDGRNPPKPAITQLRRIWVTAVSHGHPESDSTLLEGPDPAADFPGRGSKALRKGRIDGHHPQTPQQPDTPAAGEGSKCIPRPALEPLRARSLSLVTHPTE